MSQEKSKTMPMQIFFLGGGRGVKEVYYGICASSEYKICISKDYSHFLGFCLVRFKSGVVVFVSIFSK